ncbi:hypothetical protein EI94DRAFT_1709940 [Lactarius quietus]|nr:hypothetical protein EI94DRAFT_1709940 [Lactarius quietus]
MDKGLRTVLVLKFSNKATFLCRNNRNSLPHGSHSIRPTSLPFVTRGSALIIGMLFSSLVQLNRKGRQCEAVPPPGRNTFCARRQAPTRPPPPPSKHLGDTARKVVLTWFSSGLSHSSQLPKAYKVAEEFKKHLESRLGLVIKEERGKVGRHIGPHSRLSCWCQLSQLALLP